MAASASGSNASSIIAEMHYQKGMTDIKQDLQRKIVTYQTILKKTYAQAEKDKQSKRISIGSAAAKKSSRDGSMAKGVGSSVSAANVS